MRFLVDAQLPPALARWLSNRAQEAEHVMDCGLVKADDRAIWQFALDHDQVIVTKDEDFALRRTLEAAGPAVVWLRMGNTRTDDLFRRLEPLLPELLLALDRGETLLEVS